MTIHMPRKDAAASDHVCPAMRIHGIDIIPAPVMASRLSRFRFGLLVLVVPAPPRLRKLETVLVSAQRGEVEELVGPHQGLDAARVGGIGVVHCAVLKRKGAHSLLLRLGLVDVMEVVVGAIFLL